MYSTVGCSILYMHWLLKPVNLNCTWFTSMREDSLFWQRTSFNETCQDRLVRPVHVQYPTHTVRTCTGPSCLWTPNVQDPVVQKRSDHSTMILYNNLWCGVHIIIWLEDCPRKSSCFCSPFFQFLWFIFYYYYQRRSSEVTDSRWSMLNTKSLRNAARFFCRFFLLHFFQVCISFSSIFLRATVVIGAHLTPVKLYIFYLYNTTGRTRGKTTPMMDNYKFIIKVRVQHQGGQNKYSVCFGLIDNAHALWSWIWSCPSWDLFPQSPVNNT